MDRSGKKGSEGKIRVDDRLCHFCGACVAVCTQDAMFLQNSTLIIHANRCTACERCLRVCPLRALTIVYKSAEAAV
jgi:L-aspartate semialdehyde sulfurtransferase ferredoxin